MNVIAQMAFRWATLPTESEPLPSCSETLLHRPKSPPIDFRPVAIPYFLAKIELPPVHPVYRQSNCTVCGQDSRDNVVNYGLHRALKSLGLPTKDVGLHAFRHGLATEPADASAPLHVLQRQMLHADVRTTLRIYSHLVSEDSSGVKQYAGKVGIQNSRLTIFEGRGLAHSAGSELEQIQFYPPPSRKREFEESSWSMVIEEMFGGQH